MPFDATAPNAAVPITPIQSPGIVAILAYDGLCAFEFGIALELFDLKRPELGVPWYECRIADVGDGHGAGCRRLAVRADGGLEWLARARTIVVPGWRDRAVRPPIALLRALRRAHARGARFLSICAGAFPLAHAGLLDGRRATTHWMHAAEFRALFPNVALQDDVLYVEDGAIVTSAGSAAGIDAGLHLIRRDFGARVANAVARRLVMPPHRDGGQAQYVETPVRLRPGRDMATVLDWARTRLDRPLRVAALARHAAMSERTFLRRFEAAMGTTPRDWLAGERIARAREILEASPLPIDDVALQSGYRTSEAFRAAFRKAVGASPAAYRRHFRH